MAADRSTTQVSRGAACTAPVQRRCGTGFAVCSEGRSRTWVVPHPGRLAARAKEKMTVNAFALIKGVACMGSKSGANLRSCRVFGDLRQRVPIASRGTNQLDLPTGGA